MKLGKIMLYADICIKIGSFEKFQLIEETSLIINDSWFL
jgi:hypothetical protein